MDRMFFGNDHFLDTKNGNDLELIDVLWRQDEDLGVGKEVYDANLRLELEKKQELERIRQQETQKAQLLAKEKEDREKQEQASRWLRENFMRDGETGEWVSRQNNTSDNGSFSAMPQPQNGNEEFPTLESALDYIFDVGTDLLARSSNSPQQNEASNYQTAFMTNSTTGLPLGQPELQQQQQQPILVQQEPAAAAVATRIEHQDSLEDSWTGLVNYLNLTTNTTDNESPVDAAVVDAGNKGCSGSCQDYFFLDDVNNNKNVSTHRESAPLFEPLTPEIGISTADQQSQSDYLLHNVTMPADTMNMSAELVSLTSASEVAAAAGPTPESMAPQPPPPTSDMNSPVDFDFNDLGFFDGLTGLESAENDDIDMGEIDDMFRTIQAAGADLLEPIMNLGDNMDTLQRLGEEMNQSMASAGSTSSHEDFDTLEGLEGAIGGSDDFGGLNNTTDLTSLRGPRHDRSKVQRLSESSNDSGFAYKNGFSSSNSSMGSTYAGSPAGSAHGAENSSLHHHHNAVGGSLVSSTNGSTSGNGTDRDPHGSRTLAQNQVAHNHTYNTPPGQVPREVKKYAQKEPSRKGPQSRDQRRAMELKIPFSIDEIIESPVETFNEMINSHKLTDAQLNLIRDIRRRGKNKVAAQNCRKRKVNVIVNLSDERSDLEKARDHLMAERAQMEQEARRMRAKFAHLYAHIFQSLRDEQGQPYDPSLYSLQQSSDGNVFLVPRNVSNSASSSSQTGGSSGVTAGGGSGSTGASSAASSASSSPSAASSSSSSSGAKTGLSGSKKRKAFHE